MASKSKKLLANAREDKARRARLELEALQKAREDANTDDDRTAADAALEEYYEAQAQDQLRKEELKVARANAKRAKAGARTSTGKRRIQWVDGGRDLVPGLSRRGKEFFAAAEGNLVKCSRDITRWETAEPYDNVRGVRRGEILMVISEHYTGSNDKDVVDIMVGPDIVKGVPAAALRPLDG